MSGRISRSGRTSASSRVLFRSTLDQVDSRSVAFLHIDMNCAPPEVAALRYFWPRLTPGAFVLLDDYAYRGYEEQHLAMNALASELDVPICSLPTGQGLLIKPA